MNRGDRKRQSATPGFSPGALVAAADAQALVDEGLASSVRFGARDRSQPGAWRIGAAFSDTLTRLGQVQGPKRLLAELYAADVIAATDAAGMRTLVFADAPSSFHLEHPLVEGVLAFTVEPGSLRLRCHPSHAGAETQPRHTAEAAERLTREAGLLDALAGGDGAAAIRQWQELLCPTLYLPTDASSRFSSTDFQASAELLRVAATLGDVSDCELLDCLSACCGLDRSELRDGRRVLLLGDQVWTSDGTLELPSSLVRVLPPADPARADSCWQELLAVSGDAERFVGLWQAFERAGADLLSPLAA